MTTELSEAILSATGASALIQKEIDPQILELQRRYAPLVRTIPSVRWGSTIYNFNTRTQVGAGGFVTDGGARPITTSSYEQTPFTIKNLQSVGGVTGYAEAVTESFGSLRQREIMGAARGLEWDIETAILDGNAGSTVDGPYPQFDGLYEQVNDFTASTGNSINWANAAFDLGLFDQMIDVVEQNAAMYPDDSEDYFFLVSSTINSRIAQLLLNQQRFVQMQGQGAIGTVEIAAGFVVPSYRGVPIVKSSFLNARGNAMGALTMTTATTGGSIAASTEYFYKVSAVIARFGEILASPENHETVGSGTSTNTITMSFTPPSVSQLGQTLSPVLYRVFRSTATGTETLLGAVDANVGLAADGVTPVVATSIVDTGATLVPQNGSTVPASFPAAYVGTNTGITPPATGQQRCYLLPRNADFMVRPYVREMQTVNIYPTTASPDSLPFAFGADTVLATRSPYFCARADNVLAQLAS